MCHPEVWIFLVISQSAMFYSHCIKLPSPHLQSVHYYCLGKIKFLILQCPRLSFSTCMSLHHLILGCFIKIFAIYKLWLCKMTCEDTWYDVIWYDGRIWWCYSWHDSYCWWPHGQRSTKLNTSLSGVVIYNKLVH